MEVLSLFNLGLMHACLASIMHAVTANVHVMELIMMRQPVKGGQTLLAIARIAES